MGGFGGNGNCYFNCLEYLNNKYECRGSEWDYEKFAHDYVHGTDNPNDTWGGTGDKEQGLDKGPKFAQNYRGSDGKIHTHVNNEPFVYLSNQFNTEGSQWTLGGNNVKGYFGSETGNNSTIVATFFSGSGVIDENGIPQFDTHCAVFTGYDEKKGFLCEDPTTGARYYVHPTNVIGAAKVNGCK